MRIIPVTDPADKRLLHYSQMTDSEMRQRQRHARGFEHGLFLIESGRVMLRALAAGVKPVSLLVLDERLDSERDLLERAIEANPDVAVFSADEAMIKRITGYHAVRGSLGVFERPELPSVDDVLEGARRVAVIDNVTNHTNVGSIFRNAAGLGLDAVLITPSCHDPLYRRASRVSMGTVFQVPWTRIGDAGDWTIFGVPYLHELGFTVAAMALEEDSIPLDDPQLAACERLALVLGNENDGLPASTIAACDHTVLIPMAGEVDSLNVAAASAVAFWELRAR